MFGEEFGEMGGEFFGLGTGYEHARPDLEVEVVEGLCAEDVLQWVVALTETGCVSEGGGDWVWGKTGGEMVMPCCMSGTRETGCGAKDGREVGKGAEGVGEGGVCGEGFEEPTELGLGGGEVVSCPEKGREVGGYSGCVVEEGMFEAGHF